MYSDVISIFMMICFTSNRIIHIRMLAFVVCFHFLEFIASIHIFVLLDVVLPIYHSKVHLMIIIERITKF
jgi:hypothetical protein